MKKTLIAGALGLSLAGTQALAQADAAPRVADRIGAPAGASEEFAGGMSAGLIFAAATVASFAVLAAAADDDSESD
ncbi:MAG: hypothetical protein H2038_00740 [Brevundimonas sp.]|jgi:hypothetical protein|uniref:hypothetical protein n=1 Tax=Brevundimonas sp. TaxID=1871086 RepID=UPI001829C7A8|nr:hypothetical protein [Brevundimonas sp.]MBA4803158.1 hypothetical protein [Brevundimonas sp.]